MRETRGFHVVLKHIGEVAGVLAAFVGIIHILNYLYVDASNDITRITWHHYYENEGKIDNLYLGSSHVFSDVDPQVLDELTGECNFDLATGRQPLNGTFYLLREAERSNKLAHVYVEMYYYTSTKDLENKDPVNTLSEHNMENTYYMKMSPNKLSYMLATAEPDIYVDYLLPFSRYRIKLGDWDYVKETVAYKKGMDYLTYQYHKDWSDGYLEYFGSGYFGSTRSVQDSLRKYGQVRILEENPMGEESREYLFKIIQYCKKRGIPITLFVSPVDHLQLISTQNYDCFVDEMKEIADEYEVPFYDFNLAREEYLPVWHNECFRDVGHLNIWGAEMFTRFLYKIVSGDEVENKKYFYDSYAEKLCDLQPAIYGIYYRDNENESETAETIVTMQIASNRNTGMEYRIILDPKEGEPYMIQDFEENKEFQIPAEEHGICTITARMAGALNEVQTMEINY